MTLMAHRKLRTVGSAGLLTLLAALAHTAVPAHAQSPAGPPALPEKIYTKSSSFDLPILMKDHTQQTLREVLLFVKAPGTTGSATTRRTRRPPSSATGRKRTANTGSTW